MAKRGRPRKVVKTFDETKDEILEKVILHLRCPSKFPPVLLTHEEIAILWAKDEKSVQTKMAICKQEQALMRKMRERIERTGITSAQDYLTSDCKRSFATIHGSTDTPE